jgi:hypothetical protein
MSDACAALLVGMGGPVPRANRDNDGVKRITLAIDDETYRRIKSESALRSMSMSALVRECLIRFLDQQTDGAERSRLLAMQNEAVAQIRLQHSGFTSADNLSREALHDRRELRSSAHMR